MSGAGASSSLPGALAIPVAMKAYWPPSCAAMIEPAQAVNDKRFTDIGITPIHR